MMRNLLLFFFAALFFACKEQEARRPITQKNTNIYKETIAQNKKINALENQIIAKYIAQDTLHNYISSQNGFWYTYNNKIDDYLTFPKTGDVVTLHYDLKDLHENEFYSKKELGVKNYIIGKQDFIPALEDGIRLMKPGETVTFIIPSYKGFGVIGDGNKIGINQTLKSTVTIIDVKSNIKNENN